MRKIGWEILLGICLIAMSAALYLAHYLIFNDARHIFLYFLGDLAFLPIEVLLVTVIVHRLLAERDRQAMLEKLNMVIEAFYSDTGTMLLRELIGFDGSFDKVKGKFVPADGWKTKDFSLAKKAVQKYQPAINSQTGGLPALRGLLAGKRDFLLRLLENPILLEHRSFTDLLWAVFHLADELEHRKSMDKLPQRDYEHLDGDIKRAYLRLIDGWLDYMMHLNKNYPYLFSLAARINPFNDKASVIIDG